MSFEVALLVLKREKAQGVPEGDHESALKLFEYGRRATEQGLKAVEEAFVEKGREEKKKGGKCRISRIH